MSINISTDISKDKLYAASMKQQKQNAEQKVQEQINKQDPNMFTGLQWAANQQTQNANPQNVQKPSNPQNGTIANNTPSSADIAAPNFEDTAMLTTTVSMHEDSVNVGTKILSKIGLNAGAIEQSFKEVFKKSKSHNLLLERFMNNMKMGGLTALMGLMGIEPEKIEGLKAEAREEALKEIHTKLSQDWAYTKAMLDITGAI